MPAAPSSLVGVGVRSPGILSGMPKPFSDAARQVMDRAAEQATRLGRNYIGTEHLLLSLLGDHEGVGASTLTPLGIAPDEVRARVKERSEHGQHAPDESLPWTPRAQRILTLAQRETRRLGDAHVEAEHLLLGSIREAEGIAAEVLISFGADLNRVRHHVRDLHAAGRDGAHHPEDGKIEHRNLKKALLSSFWNLLDALRF
jgi:ATP-dependent Clp protease ATP-binding subunit ClpC